MQEYTYDSNGVMTLESAKEYFANEVLETVNHCQNDRIGTRNLYCFSLQ